MKCNISNLYFARCKHCIINNYIFTKDELFLFIKLLNQEINIINDERKKEEFYNLPDERAKRLIKSLSKEDLDALKRQII